MFRSIPILAAVLALTGCATSMQPSQEPDRSAVLQNCPPLVPLADDSFGAVVLKLSEVAGQYHKCRAAALESK